MAGSLPATQVKKITPASTYLPALPVRLQQDSSAFIQWACTIATVEIESLDNRL